MGVYAIPTFGSVLDALVARALRNDIPQDIASRARRATERALGLRAHQALGMSARRRAETYFTSVVQRAVARGGAGSRATARMVAAAIVDDLREGGRDADHIFAELERGWGERLPADVLEEYRLQLCG